MIDRTDDQGRVVARWWPIDWTSPLIGETPRPISIFDLCELRGVVDTDRVAAGLDPIRWVGRTDDDPTFVAGLTPIRAVHFTQLRDALADLWDVADLGSVPQFRAGSVEPCTRLISIRDPLDLRSWVEAYEEARPDLAARVAFRYQSQPMTWPPLDIAGAFDDAVEMWDATGHSIFLTSADPSKLTEWRRIDTHWHSSTTDTASHQTHVQPDPSTGITRPIPVPGGIEIGALGELKVPTWPVSFPSMFSLGEATSLDHNSTGQIVRVRQGEQVVARLAYDGFGRLRKWVDTRTQHVLGPGITIPVDGHSRGDAPAIAS